MYVSLDVSAVSMPRTFQVQAQGYPLRFSQDGVVFYNTQGFLMQLLDESIPGLFALAPTHGADSDILYYSRHEFNTFFLQHDEKQGAEQPSHVIDANDPSWHQDGTPHIDHDHLIVAIAGSLDDGALPKPGKTQAFGLVFTTFSLFHHGLIGDALVEVSGQVSIDSTTLGEASLGSEGDILSNGAVSIGREAHVQGNVTGFSLDIGGEVTGTVTQATWPIELLAVDIPSGIADLGVLAVADGETRVLGPGSYRVSDLIVGSKAALLVDNTNGPVTLYVTQTVAVQTTRGIKAMDPDPEKFTIYVSGGADVTLHNDGTFFGLIYAPDSLVSISGAGHFYGAFVGTAVRVQGSAHIHYLPTLRGDPIPSWENDPATGEEASTGSDNAPVPDPDLVQLTKAVYNKSKIVIYATSDAAPDAQLSVSIDGLVTDAAMTYKADKSRYEYKVISNVNLDGQHVTLASDQGGMASTVIE